MLPGAFQTFNNNHFKNENNTFQLADQVTSKLSYVDTNGSIQDALDLKADTSDLDSKADTTDLDSWHKYNNVVEEVTVNTTGDSSVAFHGIDTSKTYKIFFDTADGSQPNFKESLLTGTTLTYTVNISSTDALPAKFRLAVKNSLS